MRSLFSPTIRPVRLAVLGLALSVVIMVSPASAATGIESLTGYGITQFVASPAGENLVSFDWDSTGALYYTTGAPNFGLGLNVYRNVGGSTTAVGMGRVISLVIMAIFSPGWMTSRSRGAPMGEERALRTSRSPVSAWGTGLGVRTP